MATLVRDLFQLAFISYKPLGGLANRTTPTSKQAFNDSPLLISKLQKNKLDKSLDRIYLCHHVAFQLDIHLG